MALLIKSESTARGYRDQWLLFCGVGLCCPAVLVALRHGQYGIMVTAFIWFFLLFETKGRSMWAGLFFALAMTKPQTAALFFLLPLARKSFATCFWCVLSIAAATAFAAWWCQTWPWTLLSEMLDVGLSHGFYMGIGDPLRVVIGENALFFSSVIIFSLITFLLLICWRWASVYQLAAIPAVFSTLWMSHRTHDLLIISLLIVPMFWLAMDKEWSDLLPYAGLAGLSHWGPHFGRFYHYWYVPLSFRLLWIFTLIYFLYFLLRTRKNNVSMFRL